MATSIAEPTSDDAAVLVSQAQHSVNKLEEVVSARLESLVTHTADMKGRMEAAQDEARVLREEVQTAESRINALEVRFLFCNDTYTCTIVCAPIVNATSKNMHQLLDAIHRKALVSGWFCAHVRSSVGTGSFSTTH